MRTGDLDQATRVLATVPEGTEGRDRPVTRLQMMEEAAGMGEIADIEAALAEESGRPRDCVIRRPSWKRCSGNYEAALASRDVHPAEGPEVPRRHRPHDAGPDFRVAAEGFRPREELSPSHVRADALINVSASGETASVRGIAVTSAPRSLSCCVDNANLAVALAWKLGNWHQPRGWYFHLAALTTVPDVQRRHRISHRSRCRLRFRTAAPLRVASSRAHRLPTPIVLAVR